MPTYNSLGISATLLVTDLDQTLSPEILLRMGKDLQQDTKRIQDLLSNDRALREQPASSKVGVFQFLGEDEDMVLLAVAAGDGQGKDNDGIVDGSDCVQGERSEDTNAATTSSTEDNTLPLPTPMQTTSGRKKSKRIANNQRTSSNSGKRNEQLTESSTTPFDQIAATAAQSSEPLALSLKVDFTKFYEKDKGDAPLLNGKDLKLEVFINGQVVDVTYESSRTYRRTGLIQYSGTRFHRQAEKPWVYVPTAAISSNDVDSTPKQRWADISESLVQEANTRGTNIWDQRPITAQFLAALARSKLPEPVRTKSQHFAVVDLVITAGKGRKFGPDTIYLSEPTRLTDPKFSSLAPVADSSGPRLDQDGDLVLQDDTQTFGGDPFDFTNFRASNLTGETFDMPSEQPHIPATPRTPKTMDIRTAQKLKGILDATPIKKLLSKYENAKGHVKGKRTLRQRFGDMSKMSPRKQQEVLSMMDDEIDEDTMNAIKAAFESDDPTPATSGPKKEVRFSFSEDVVAPAPMADDTFGTQMLATTADSLSLTFPQIDDTPNTQPLATTVDPLSLTFSQIDQFVLEDNFFEPHPQLHPTMTSETNMDFLHTTAIVNPPDLSPPKTRSKRTPASALSGSPTSTPVKYHHFHRKYDATTQLADPFVDDQPVFDLPALQTPLPVTPQQTSASSAGKNKKGTPNTQTPSQALEEFQIPDLWKGSTVSYAEGLKQRQAVKARGGEFEEQQFVVGMRFFVL